MCEKYGFKKPKVDQKFCGFGWSDLRDETSWSNHDGIELQQKISKEIVKLLGKSNFYGR